MELVHDEKILWQGRPSWRSQLSFFMLWVPVALLPVIVAGLLRANDVGTGLPYWQWLFISLALVALVIGYDFLRRFATFYVVSNQRLRVRTGILSRREQTARFERVQNVSISQTLLDRVFKVGSVQFDTAGTDSSDSNLNFRGISDPQELVRVVAHHSRPKGEDQTAGL
jgi:uncharacterized membrane protein YdbT with pleckstrin-like domain